MFFDRRRQKRYRPPAGESVEVQIMAPGLLEVLSAVDINEHGVGVALPPDLALEVLDGEVELIVTLPRARPMHMYGVIKYSGGAGKSGQLGIEFSQISERARDTIARYVARLKASSCVA